MNLTKIKPNLVSVDTEACWRGKPCTKVYGVDRGCVCRCWIQRWNQAVWDEDSWSLFV